MRFILFFMLVILTGCGATVADSGQDWPEQGTIKPVSSKPPPLPNQPERDDKVDISYRCWISLTCDLDDFFERQDVCAFYVMHRGETVFFKTMTPNQSCENDIERGRYGIASIMKSLTSLQIGQAITDGLGLSVNMPAADALLKAGIIYPQSDLTVRDLLQMSSGMEWNDRDEAIRIVADREPGDPATIRQALTERLKTASFHSGTPFNYSGFDSQLLGTMLEAHLPDGERMGGFFERTLWQHIEGRKPAKWKGDTEKSAAAYCCWQFSAVDMAALGEKVLDWYTSGSGPMGNWMRQSIDNNRRSDLSCSYSLMDQDEIGYGYQWWVLHDEDGQTGLANRNGFTGHGTGGQYLHIFPEQKAVIVQLSSKQKNDQPRNMCEAFLVHRSVADLLAN